ncbi:MAG: cell wall hydrolase [Pseudomonadota bacterium]
MARACGFRPLAAAAIVLLAACDGGREVPPPTQDIQFPVDPAKLKEAAARAADQPAEDPFALDDPQTCLAMVMYHEARGEGELAMVAVGQVVINRVDHRRFPSSVCGVVRQGGETAPCQFSWWCDGRSDLPREESAWENARDLAARVLAGSEPDPTGGATYFYSGPDPYWAASFTETTRIGGHIFMVE